MPRKKKPQRVRVKKLCESYNRATLVDKVKTERAPSRWPYSPALARVRFDHGLECWVPSRRPSRIKEADDYEALFADVEAGIDAILSGDAIQTARHMAHVGLPNGVRHHHNTAVPLNETALVPNPANRYVGLLKQLPDFEGFEVAVALLESWTAPGLDAQAVHPWGEGMTHYNQDDYSYRMPDGFRLAQVCELMLGALVPLLSIRRHEDGPPLSADLRARLTELLPRLDAERETDGRLHPSSPHRHLLTAAEGGALPVLRDYLRPSWSHYPIEEFGVDSDLPVLI